MKADEIYGTKNPTPHRVLLDTRFELPFGETPAFCLCCLDESVTHTAPLHVLILGHFHYYFIIYQKPSCVMQQYSFTGH